MYPEVLIRFSDERQIREPGQVPKLQQSHMSDAGWDLPAWLPDGPVAMYPGERIAVQTGTCICPPAGVAFRIIGRSSTYFKLGLEVSESLVDPGYQGALKIMLLNRTDRVVAITDGQRLAQIIFFRILPVALVPVGEFPFTERGSSGLGSTGK